MKGLFPGKGAGERVDPAISLFTDKDINIIIHRAYKPDIKIWIIMSAESRRLKTKSGFDHYSLLLYQFNYGEPATRVLGELKRSVVSG